MAESGVYVDMARGGAAGSVPHPLPPPLDVVLERGCPVSGLEDLLLEVGDVEALAVWHAMRPALEAACRLRYRVVRAGESILSFVPGVSLQAAVDTTCGGRVRLSRFAHVRRDRDVLVLDSPRATGRVEMEAVTGVELVAHLATAESVDRLTERLGGGTEWVPAAIAVLQSAGLVLPADDDGSTLEDRDVHAAGWEFHDLVLHERSRSYRRDLRVGATYRFVDTAGKYEEPGARRRESTTIPLARPDIEALAERDPPFTRVLESRRSRRFHGATPIGIEQLGEFLFRTARVTPLDVDGSGRSDARYRLYPGGGACHPLEVYVLVARCAGLAPGCYHYLADAHALDPVDADETAVQSILGQSAVPMERGSTQQVQLVFTARFHRINRRYEGNAYALVLQEVGALYQTMYLVATAMGLAPCAVGGGNADAFARLIGTDPLEEASVGAFVLGRP